MSGRDRAKVIRADVLLGGRRVAALTTQPLLTTIPRTRLARRASSGPLTLRVRAELRDGRLLTLDDRLRACPTAGR